MKAVVYDNGRSETDHDRLIDHYRPRTFRIPNIWPAHLRTESADVARSRFVDSSSLELTSVSRDNCGVTYYPLKVLDWRPKTDSATSSI
jgi:hypothetical protein